MIIGVKYWARGASAPSTWTNLHVAICESDFEKVNYDEGEALDGEIFGFGRRRYYVNLVIDPLSFNHATYASVVTALRGADFCRIKDTRYTWLGDTNTLDFIVPSHKPNREEPSILTTSVSMNMRAREVI